MRLCSLILIKCFQLQEADAPQAKMAETRGQLHERLQTCMGSSVVSRTQDLSTFLPRHPWSIHPAMIHKGGSKAAIAIPDATYGHDQIQKQSRKVFPSMHLSFQGKNKFLPKDPQQTFLPTHYPQLLPWLQDR